MLPSVFPANAEDAEVGDREEEVANRMSFFLSDLLTEGAFRVRALFGV